MCGEHFLLRASLFHHQAAELPGFREEHAAKRAGYEADRAAWRAAHPEYFHLKTVGRSPNDRH
jgi:hypothetical protein